MGFAACRSRRSENQSSGQRHEPANTNPAGIALGLSALSGGHVERWMGGPLGFEAAGVFWVRGAYTGVQLLLRMHPTELKSRMLALTHLLAMNFGDSSAGRAEADIRVMAHTVPPSKRQTDAVHRAESIRHSGRSGEPAAAVSRWRCAASGACNYQLGLVLYPAGGNRCFFLVRVRVSVSASTLFRSRLSCSGSTSDSMTELARCSSSCATRPAADA